jgi:photosystem II stability/assembly factor-like uncharacterized protein
VPTVITAYLSPNGDNLTRGSGPAACLKVATIKGVATLTRSAQGDPWRHESSTLEDLHIGSLLLEPVSGRLLAGAHENQGLWISDDGEGKSWRQVQVGLTQPHVYALAQRNAGSKATLYLGTQPVGVYRSDDSGDSWTELVAIQQVPDKDKWTFPGPPHIPHVKCFTVHPTNPKCFFVLIEQGGLFKTLDGGESFVELTGYSRADDLAYRDLHRLLINPANPNDMFLATGEGLYRSDDGGEHWEHLLKRGGIIGYPDDLFFDPADARTLYVAGAVKSPNEWMRTNRADPVILKSTDRGDSWAELDNGLTKPVGVAYEAMGQHVWPGGYMLTVAGADGRIWTSEDKGASWSQVAAKLAPVSKDHHYLPFLPQEERQKWLARRQERTGHIIKFGPPPR